MKKGLILNFSPNKKGSSSLVSKQIYNSLVNNSSLDLINIYELDIRKCDSCQDYCYKKGICKIKRDDMELLYKHFENDDFVIIATPVYFYHIPGYAKIMIDRCQPYWVRKYVLKKFFTKEKIGTLICIGATKGEKLFSGINLTIKYFFDIFNINFNLRHNLYLKKVEFSSELYIYTDLINSYIKRLKDILFEN